MKIAIDISQTVHEGTGVAVYTRNLVESILRIDKKNRYILFGLSLRKHNKLSDIAEEIAKKCGNHFESKFIHLPPYAGDLLWNKIHLFNLDRILGNVDLFHSSDWIQPPIHAKKITTVHDLVILKYPQTSQKSIIETQKNRLRWVKEECDAVIADSDSTRDDLIDILHFDPGKIEVVYPGVDSRFTPVGNILVEQVKRKYGLMDDYILTVGRIEPRKNLKMMISAFSKFLKHPLISSMGKPIELIVIGKSGWGEDLVPARNIRLLGFVNERDLPALYSGAYLFAFPSLYEGFGLPVVESFACGCPVVTSDRGSLKEISDGAALFVDPLSPDDLALKMVKIFMDRQLRTKLIENGYKRATQFSWELTAEKTVNIYRRLVRH